MEDREKILRWNLLEARRKYDNSDNVELPLASMVFLYRETLQIEINNCEKELNKYLKIRNYVIR